MRLRTSLENLNLGAQGGDLSPKLRLVVAQLVQHLAERIDREGQLVDLGGHFP